MIPPLYKSPCFNAACPPLLLIFRPKLLTRAARYYYWYSQWVFGVSEFVVMYILFLRLDTRYQLKCGHAGDFVPPTFFLEFNIVLFLHSATLLFLQCCASNRYPSLFPIKSFMSLCPPTHPTLIPIAAAVISIATFHTSQGTDVPSTPNISIATFSHSTSRHADTGRQQHRQLAR